MLKKLVPFAFASVFLFSFAASADVTQPSPTEPSKCEVQFPGSSKIITISADYVENTGCTDDSGGWSECQAIARSGVWDQDDPQDTGLDTNCNVNVNQACQVAMDNYNKANPSTPIVPAQDNIISVSQYSDPTKCSFFAPGGPFCLFERVAYKVYHCTMVLQIPAKE